MTTFKLYGIWERLLAQWLPEERKTRRTNLIWLIVGLYLGGRVQLSAIVNRWPQAAHSSSLTRRLSRFLDNAAIRPAVRFRRVAQQLLASAAQRPVTLVVDASKVGAGHQLVQVALAQHGRTLPIAWEWVSYAKGVVATATQLALFKRVQGLLPDAAQVMLVGDAGFSSVKVLQQLEAWGWHYVLRQKGSSRLQRAGAIADERLDGLVTGPGQQVWLPDVKFTAQWQHPTNVLAVWQTGYAHPWLLTTNLPSAYRARQAYARRMWIEEMFGDWKDHGWDLESTHLRHPDRLSRLLLALALLYVWLMLWGERLIKAGCRAWVDRHNRRDLSRFRIALDTLTRCFTLARQIPIPTPSLVGDQSVR
jgi:hypothetical protein